MPPVRLSLFWRTFALIGVLIVASLLAWSQLFQVLEREHRAERFAFQLASLVNLTRAALITASAERRSELLDDLASEEGIRVFPKEPADRTEPWPDRRVGGVIELKLQQLLGPRTRLAARVNRMPGMWVSFDIDGDEYWVLLDQARLHRYLDTNWLGWAAIAIALAMLGALVISRIVNRPLANLASAIDRLSRGERAPTLPEDAPTEIADVNRRFNRLATDLAALEADRAEALAGISHDIRTPLTRLRMEIELSPLTEAERQSMASEIDRIDAIVRQFVEFAQPSDAEPVERVDVGALIGSLAAGYQRADAGDSPQMTLEIEPDVGWIGQPTVLARILANLLENARRYGRTPGEPRAEVRVGARRDGRWLVLTVRDRGPGVPASQLPRLARPFTRLDTERSHHGGSGLGLAIVARLARRYGGQLQLDLPPDGGLSVQVRLQDAG